MAKTVDYGGCRHGGVGDYARPAGGANHPLPVGGGNYIAGCAIAAKSAATPPPQIIGVQSEAAPAVTESMRQRRIVQIPTTSFAGEIATTAPVPTAFAVMQELVDDMLLVSEQELLQSIGLKRAAVYQRRRPERTAGV